jgi:thiol-disulfide isomerase/thioredoxin
MRIYRCALSAALLLSLGAGAAPEPLPIRPAADAGKLVAEAGRGQPVVLHFWATWCAACREEFPRLRRTLESLQARGVSVLLVSIDPPKEAAAARAMLEKYGVADLPAILLDAPAPDPVAAALEEPKWTGDLPATFVYDGAGKKVRAFLGRVGPAALRKAVRAAQKVSGGTPPPAPR